MRTQVPAWLAPRKPPRTFLCVENLASFADEVDGAMKRYAIDHDLDSVAVTQFADRSSRKCLRRNVTDARAGRHTAEPRVSQHRNVLAMRQLLQRRRNLVNLLHARAQRPAAYKHQHITMRNFAGLDRLDRRSLSDKHTSRPLVPINIVLVDQRRIDRRALDHRSIRREISSREANRRRQPA